MNFLADLRLALRRLGKQPGFTVTTIVTLALAIGANTAIFSVIDAVLMHPSGVDAPQRLAVMRARYARMGLDFPVVSVPDYSDAASLTHQVESAAIERSVAYNADHDGAVEHFDGAQVSWQWFNVFGAKPILGRAFTPEEDHPAANQVAILSYGLWQSVFGGDRNVIGQSLMLDQTAYRVVGVMRSDFDWPRGTAIWTPMGLPPQAFAPENLLNESYTGVIRLRPQVTLAALNAGLAAKVREENLRNKGFGQFLQQGGWGIAAVPLTEFAAGPLRRPLYVLFGVVILVLLIAAANVAGLFLARTSSRLREFAIRTAMGASVGSLVRQLLSETLLLAGFATVIGIALGATLGNALLWMVPHSLAEGYTVKTSWGVLIFTAGVGLVTVLICGVGPAVKMTRLQPNLQGSGRTMTASQERQRLRSLFVIGEVALAFVLLTGAGMFIASLRQLQQVEPGFNPRGILAGTVYYAGAAYKNNQDRQEAFVTTILNNLANQPGVQGAAATSSLPFSNQGGASSFHIEGRPETGNDPGPHSQNATASADYLKVMQIPLLAGRWISNDDRAHTEPVVVIDQKLAHKYWPNENPIGKRLKSVMGTDTPTTIVGVVGNVRSSSLEEDSGDGMRYYPYSQLPWGGASFVVRTQGNPYLLAPVLRRAITAADATQTIFDISSLESRVNASLASRRLIVWLLTAFSGLALLLALIGIYGLISYVTVQRTNEFGIRMALGAQRGQVVGLVLKSALAWVTMGLAIGVIISGFVTSTLKHNFAAFGVDVIPSLLIALTALLIVGAVAGLLPAQRAASTDPATILRNE